MTMEAKIVTFDGIPSSKVLVGGCVARWLTLEPFDNEWVQVNHRHVIFVHVEHTLPRDARGQRRDRRERGRLRHCVKFLGCVPQ
jgi:hypothetical protein